VAWSGIAIDAFETVMSGILPYVLPLFLGIPFNEKVVMGANAVLTFHALMLHSSCLHRYPGALGWLLLSPVDHNKHHNYGERQAHNFAAIFKVWDRMGGTLCETEALWFKDDQIYHGIKPAVPPSVKEEKNERKKSL
jgi:sterol desaturase/sphingolipid hydroxylase (fatty acid hydroxylase superfamily)